MIISNYEQGSENWYEEKIGRITGTRFKDLMGTPLKFDQLLYQVASEILTEDREDTYASLDMMNGIEREPFAIEEYETLFGVEVESVGFVIPEEDHIFHDIIGCSPDGLVENGFIEVKSPKAKTHLKYLVDNEIPKDYYWQIMGNLYVTGLDYCDFISYYPGMKLYVNRVLPDEDVFNDISENLKNFVADLEKIVSKYKKYSAIEA